MKKMGFLTLTLSLLFLPTLAFAADDSEESVRGGWIEGEGYWSNVNDQEIGIFAEPDNHTGWKEVDESGDDNKYRAVGSTNWEGERHYTRARMKGHLTGYLYADSGRVYGTDHTEAKSDWTKRNARAVTNWGT